MPDEKATRIVWILKDQIFTVVGPREKSHSNQGQSFESYILSELCKAFRITKSRITPYHPMGDGLVEQMNRTLLSLLHTYTCRESWKMGRTSSVAVICISHNQAFFHGAVTT